MDDLQAIQRLKQRDISGLEFLITRYQRKALAVACLVTRNESMSEDIVQESFVRFYERVRHFDETCPFEPYFLSSVFHAALNAAEREKRQIDLPGEDDESDQIEALMDRTALVEDYVQRSQLKQEILDALNKLSPRQRAAIIQRYYLGMSEKEMSEALEAAPGTIKWLLNAARQKLCALLSSERMQE